MSYLEYNVKRVPTGLSKVLYVNWALVLLLTAVAGIGFMMLYSVAGGRLEPWADPQMKRFALGMTVMFVVAFVPIWFWRNMAALAYGISVLLLVAVDFFGTVGMGAQRWIDLGVFRLQPSELSKITLVMMLAAYYDWLDIRHVSKPQFVALPLLLILLPTALVLKQPDLGTALLLIAGGGIIMFLAGVHWAYFAVVVAGGVGLVSAVFASRGTPWQLLKDYQFRRIDTFLDPSSDPLGAGYHITQSKIALGSGGWAGRGFMQGTQSRLNFLPEKHTDFIFTTLAEEFGFIGGISLLALYVLIIVFCISSAMQTRDRFSSLLTLGIAATFFLFFAVNMSMVMGLAPVVGVPLPLVSYGGSAMLVLLAAFGLVQSAHIHRPRGR
ncbi:rod shape-determining protein RodA [Rhodovulum sp. BSW8]|uniref:Peptidoglycan glycosyltransferase MrdB n=1 Tax=Rhodovulum visakhapatnamense TaxID=364297 RepID=A0A4R8FNS5_9RHOB|nr:MULTISPECIES: rod shape-determining protein RodA [Rhodovulum]OLS45938.1 rod shape-determining protein RodA [Rhodovulum sulfidophilum]MBL3571686.1 rod shape-determining protein RodA [Rhodovulum visakhapatnamense]MBL3580548.1 rod shape-determining protein RodA [Rhodovulum visakhapatnamense]RBO51980.1 rod shape-determining protein RodA [Rhodovulum sp. BSW8]TDX28014.1 cell elongation-specific peptidoglycan biosynthesis regulator RodA [Rhodovulum visakhapatnamense]